MWAILDCGTTNTKCYLIESDGKLYSELYVNSGCRSNVDVAEKNTYGLLLSRVVQECVLQSGHDYSELCGVIAFGMVSSDLGLVVLPHLKTPVSFAALRDGVVDYSKSELFGEGVRFLIIRGVKNALISERDDRNIDFCDFMRGEETQVTGVRALYSVKEQFNVITLGTHFKVIHCDASGTIKKSMTTMSGQVFDCLVNQTIIGKSVKGETESKGSYSREELISLSSKMIQRYGFNRAILLPRFMASFCNYTERERMIYLDGVIANDDIHAMSEFVNAEELRVKKYFIIGQLERSLDMKIALELVQPDVDVTIIDGTAKNRDVSIAGAIEICRDYISSK